ncbi:unnamed protein product [Scytosiphon promiscuus]
MDSEPGAAPPGGAAEGFDPEQVPQQQEGEHREVLSRDDTNGIVVFGQFVAGSLVGIIISAPAFVVLFIGSSGSLVTKAGSKVGKFSRKLEKWASDILLDLLKQARQFNYKHRLTATAKLKLKKAASKMNFEVHKRGLLKNARTKASNLWTTIDKRTAPSRSALEA